MKRSIAIGILISFVTTIICPARSYAAPGQLNLPVPGTMVNLSQSFAPVILKGVRVYPDNPLRFDFILDTGDSKLKGQALKDESNRLIKYFLASLTVPEKDLWVNLSPYEKDRIVPESFGVTQMGRDLLAEDYILKQMTASLIYPEDELGKKFWKRIYEEAQAKYHTTNIPVNTFNKVWIVPEHASVYKNGTSAFVTKAHLKVMLEADYLAMNKNAVSAQAQDANQIGSQIVREIVLPALEKEINEGQNFIQLRQIYNSLILAIWFKRNLKESVLGKIYMGQNKVGGVDIQDKNEKQKIYQSYLEAYKKGVYNYIKEDRDPVTQKTTPRKYFSGGAWMSRATNVFSDEATLGDVSIDPDHAMLVKANLKAEEENISAPKDRAMIADIPRVLQDKDVPAFRSIRDRILWLSTRMIEEANRNKEDVNVGGHQAAAASSLDIMMALELFTMNGPDFVAHKPHAGPVYHAIQYLLGKLSKETLSRLRENAISPDYSSRLQETIKALPPEAAEQFRVFQSKLLEDLPLSANSDLDKEGLHSYPGMADPDRVLIPTGSVGLGPAATIALALSYKWMKDHGYNVPDPRFYAVVGDSEFGEGNYQEILPLVQQFGLKNITHILDYNRQSLDGNTQQWRLQNIKDRYAANGWKIIELKWGSKLKAAFADGGQKFREVMDALPQEEYQDMTGKTGAEIREYLINKETSLARFLEKYNDEQLYDLYTDLAGHDLQVLTSALQEAKISGQSVAIIAHTIKGKGLRPLIGQPGNHSMRLTPTALEDLRKEMGISEVEPFPAFDAESVEGKLLNNLKDRIDLERQAAAELISSNSGANKTFDVSNIPSRITPSSAIVPTGLSNVSTQVWFGYIISMLRGISQKSEAELTDEERSWLPIAKRIVTISPDVATSTGVGKKGKLAGYGPDSLEDTHIRLGIEEMNALTVAAALGKMRDFMGQSILPVVTIYDMFLFRRALDPAFYAQYWKSRVLMVGTPSGSTLAPEGAQHQSITSAVIGGALPNTIVWDPAFGVELEYILGDELKRTLSGDYEGRNVIYLRGSTLDQSRKELAARLAVQKRFKGREISEKNLPEEWSEDLLKGGYRLVDYTGYAAYDPNVNVVNIITVGPMVKEALRASDKLLERGIYANVIVVSSSSLLHGNLGRKDNYQHLRKLIPVNETFLTPTVAVADASPDYLAGIAGILGLNLEMPTLGLRKNGVSTRGTARIYIHHGISFKNIAETALAEIRHRDSGHSPKVQMMQQWASKQWQAKIYAEIARLEDLLEKTSSFGGAYIRQQIAFYEELLENGTLDAAMNAALNDRLTELRSVMETAGDLTVRTILQNEIDGLGHFVSEKDSAQTVTKKQELGGIDLNAAKMNIKEEGNDISARGGSAFGGKLPPVDLKAFENKNFNGFTPIIIEIVPIKDLPMVLGASQPQEKLASV